MPQDYATNLNKYPPLHTVLHHNARPGVLHWLIHERSNTPGLYFNGFFEPVFPTHVWLANVRLPNLFYCSATALFRTQQRSSARYVFYAFQH